MAKPDPLDKLQELYAKYRSELPLGFIQEIPFLLACVRLDSDARKEALNYLIPAAHGFKEAVKAMTDARMDVESVIPEVDTPWPKGYDFKELERLRYVSNQADEAADAAEKLLASALRVAERANGNKKEGKTGSTDTKSPKRPKAKKAGASGSKVRG